MPLGCAMPLPARQPLGPCEILSPMGAGRMGYGIANWEFRISNGKREKKAGWRNEVRN